MTDLSLTPRTITSASARRLWLEPAERVILQITGMVVFLNLVQILWRGVAVDWWGYGTLTLVSLACFAGGQYYRISGRSARIGLALVCTGLFPVFSWSIVMFNYLMMPTVHGNIDQWLVWVDSLVGYHWPDVIHWAAENPGLNTMFRIAYMTTIPQIGLLIIVLGLTGRARQLHTMMVSITITSVLAVVFWGYFPTHGAKSLFTLPSAVEMAANPIVTTQYGRDLLHMAANGPGLLSPDSVKGLIAFPSYHAVLAFTAIYAMRGVRFLFPVYLVLNLLIIPATPLHGGHHLVDILGGLILFLIGTFMAERLVARYYAGRDDCLPKDAAKAPPAQP
ncbi:MAG: phosphatase PAP2 family protein [Pseudomonadota bacterium]